MKTVAKKRPQPWLDFDISDRPGEQWKHVPNYDGIYEASSDGRVKSLTRWSGNRLLKDRIMSQRGSAAAALTLCQDGHQQPAYVMPLVMDAFGRTKPDDHVWYHTDKNQFNNRLTNIAHGTHGTSQAVAYATGALQAVRPDGTTQGDYMRERKRQHEAERGVFDGGQLVAKHCTACNMEKPVGEFRRAGTATSLNGICRECKLIRQGVKDVGKAKNAAELLAAGVRVCSVCRRPKQLDQDFPRSKNAASGYAHRCKACANDYAQRSGAVAVAKQKRHAAKAAKLAALVTAM